MQQSHDAKGVWKSVDDRFGVPMPSTQPHCTCLLYPSMSICFRIRATTVAGSTFRPLERWERQRAEGGRFIWTGLIVRRACCWSVATLPRAGQNLPQLGPSSAVDPDWRFLFSRVQVEGRGMDADGRDPYQSRPEVARASKVHLPQPRRNSCRAPSNHVAKTGEMSWLCQVSRPLTRENALHPSFGRVLFVFCAS